MCAAPGGFKLRRIRALATRGGSIATATHVAHLKQQVRCSSSLAELRTGGTVFGEVVNDLSMPIHVGGRHWGAIRVGFDSERLR